MYAATVISRKSFWLQATAVIMIIVLLLAALPAKIVSAAETPFFPPSVATTVGKSTWVNPTFVFVSDNRYATASVNKVLKLGSFDIDSIPGDASIDGIAFAVEGKTSGTRQVKVQLSGDNGLTWSPALTTDLSSTEDIRILGGASNLWGRSWTPSQFTNANFVARMTPVGIKTSGTVYIDQVQVKVYYTPNSIPLTVQADPQAKHYGYPEPEFTYQVTSGALLPGDSFSGFLVRDPGDLPGLYQINQGSLTAGPGYTINYVPDFLTIDKAPLTVTAQSYWKLASDPDVTSFAYSYTGFVLGEDETALSAVPTCSLPPGTDQTVDGVYPITCTGAAADNYDISYVDGSLTVKTFNNPPTDITLTPASVEENHLAGFTVGTLGNNDPDPDPFAYSFCTADDNGAFVIEGNLLKTAAKFNYETKNSYSICVAVDDHFHGTFEEPVTVAVTDLPETFRSVASQDGWVLESSETSNQGGTKDPARQTFRLGDDAANRQYRAILSFPTGQLPNTAVITQIALRIRRAGPVVGTNPFLTHGKINVDARKGYFGAGVGLELSDFQAKPTKAAWRTISNQPANSWYSATLAASNILMINRTGPTQFRLRFNLDDNNDLGADYMSFFSGNALLANRPILQVEYYLP